MVKLIILLSLVVSLKAFAAVIQVFPGKDTLKNAVSAATEGDTLVLITGVYTGERPVLNKSLTIRAATQTKPIISGISFSYYSAIDGARADIEITMQGLKFIGIKESQETHANLSQFKKLSLINNEFINFPVIVGNDSQVVGNYFDATARMNSAKYRVQLEVTGQSAYVAGNTFTKEIQGSVDSDVQKIYFVGNNIEYSSLQYIAVDLSGAHNYAVANRFKHDDHLYSGSSLSTTLLWTRGTLMNEVHNNLFDINAYGAFADHEPHAYTAIRVENYANVHNNLVHVDGTMIATSVGTGAIEFLANANGTSHGNIVTNFAGPAFKDITPNQSITISHNLCFGNTDNTACSAANNGITLDPNFADTVNFKLNSGSPAINKGLDNDLFDIDGSRQDIGLHGGPWGFEFYDDQRSNGSKPYLYPYFDQITLKSSGQVDIKVLSVARFQ